MTNEEIEALINKNPSLRGAEAKLASMEAGSYCLHRGFGLGKITAYNADTQKLIIDFETKPAHPMGAAFCVTRLEILGEKNILVRQQNEPQQIEEMIKKRPADLVAEVLATYPEQEATSAELEGALSRLLGTRFKKWWTSTKKQLEKDPRIATPSRKTGPYVLRDEPLHPEEEILESFYTAKQPKKKIALAEKLYQISDNVEMIAKDLPNIFDNLTHAVAEARGLGQAARLHGVWVRNDLARHLEEDPETIEPTSKSLVLDYEDRLDELAENIPNGYQRRFLDLISRVYPDTWQEVVVEILRNSQGKMTSECISFLVDNGCEALVADSLRRWLKEQNMRGPVLYWVIKNRNSRKFKTLVDGLIGPKFLSAVLYAIDAEALQNATMKRIQLADTLSDDLELIPDMLESANEEVARDLAQSLMLNQGFEELTKKSLIARFIKLFPYIQSLVSGDTETSTEQLIVSQVSLDKRKAEYEELVNVKIPENKKAIEVAKEHGDLKENSEYKMARQDNETLMARKAQLEVDFNRCRVSDFTEVTLDQVGVGSVVTLSQKGLSPVQYAILGAWDSAPEQNILSYKTPLGQALVGKAKGDTAQTEIDGNVESWLIEDLERWVDTGRSL
jgi:transcription elongation GreA/GreB family factor